LTFEIKVVKYTYYVNQTSLYENTFNQFLLQSITSFLQQKMAM